VLGLPATATRNAARLIAARIVRAFADGLVSVLLPAYLTLLGYDAVQIGGIATATLLGSAACTLLVGLYAHRFRTRALLFSACALMAATGLGFATVHALVPLVAIAIAGTLNPTAGDVSVFLPLEQSLLANEVDGSELASLYARSNVAASAASGLGALASAFPAPIAKLMNVPLAEAMRWAFVVYAVAAVIAALLYARLRPAASSLAGADSPVSSSTTTTAPASIAPRARRQPLSQSRGIVLQLSALFTLDSFAGGFVVQSLLALWLLQRFQFSLTDAASFFFAAAILSGGSQLLSPVLARRIGLIPTMVYTHLPANGFLILAALMPNAELAVLFLLLRSSLSSMDVPARQAFVMSVVPPEERAAAASVTNVPRSLGTGLAPLLSGMLLAASSFGWPLVVAGSLKVVYDLLLLRGYRDHVASRPG
jgi:MFS family permease